MTYPTPPSARQGDRFDWAFAPAPRRPRSRAVREFGPPVPRWADEAARLIGSQTRVLEIAGPAPALPATVAAAARSFVCLLAPSAGPLPAARGAATVLVRGRPEDLAAAGRHFDAVVCWTVELGDAEFARIDALIAPEGRLLVRRTPAAEAAWERADWRAENFVETAEGTLAELRRRNAAAAGAMALRAA